MFFACGVSCVVDASSVSPSSELILWLVELLQFIKGCMCNACGMHYKPPGYLHQPLISCIYLSIYLDCRDQEYFFLMCLLLMFQNM